MKILFALSFILAAQSSFAAQGPCERQAVTLVEAAERISNPLLKKGERLAFSAQTTYSTSPLSTVAVQVRFNDRSTALYEVVFNAFNDHCSTVSSLRRRAGK